MFHFETSLEEWKHLQSCWVELVNTLKSDDNNNLKNSNSNTDNCIFILNTKLFNSSNPTNDNCNNEQLQSAQTSKAQTKAIENDITIETMTDLMDQIENEIQNNNNNNNNNNNDSNDISQPYPSSVMTFISKPVKFYTVFVVFCLCVLFLAAGFVRWRLNLFSQIEAKKDKNESFFGF